MAENEYDLIDEGGPPRPVSIDRESPAIAAAQDEASPDITVSVHSPELVSSTLLKSYYTFSVDTLARDLAEPLYSTRRRFRDFDWLHSRLGSSHPGVVVPPLPEKQAAVDQALQASGVSDDAAWLEQRITELNVMLRRIYAHPLLRASADLKAFLEEPHAAFSAYKEAAAAAAPDSYAAKLSEVGQGMGSLLSAVPLFGAAAAPAAAAETDAACERQHVRMDALALHTAKAHRGAASCAVLRSERATALAALGEELEGLVGNERCSYAKEETAGAAELHALMARAVGRASVAHEELARAEHDALAAPLHDLVREVGACQAAIGTREAALARLNRAADALAGKRAAFERQKAAGAPREELLARKAEWEASKQHRARARAEDGDAAHNLHAELAAFEAAQVGALKQAALRFAATQLAHAEREEALWQALRDELLPEG